LAALRTPAALQVAGVAMEQPVVARAERLAAR